ncbi:hypothetical protein SNE40_003794 [Patella caerulea]|uniref:Serine protease n=1 Tax=Patella caerulea TaxID=87958 RepID=A0AAN8Q913_PATCE
MKAEISTESVPRLDLASTCTKNPNHEGFVNFDDFNISHLPLPLRREDYFKYIQILGNRVVRLAVQKEDGGCIYGSGFLYKVGPLYVIATNDHVIGSEEDARNCTVDFFFNSPESPNTDSSYGESLLGGSDQQDLSLFTFKPVPKRVEEMNLFDNSGMSPYVSVHHDDLSVTQRRGYVCKTRGKWLVMVSRRDLYVDKLVSCEINFMRENGCQTYPATFVGISRIEEKMIGLEITDVPDFVPSVGSSAAPWPNGRDFVPVVIAHPHGGPKQVTVGKTMAVEMEGFVGKIYHTARTCPGSSGGLVITVGGDASSYVRYTAGPAIHCEGDKADTFRAVPTETGNIGASIFVSI